METCENTFKHDRFKNTTINVNMNLNLTDETLLSIKPLNVTDKSTFLKVNTSDFNKPSFENIFKIKNKRVYEDLNNIEVLSDN
jgi:hypothetical protein